MDVKFFPCLTGKNGIFFDVSLELIIYYHIFMRLSTGFSHIFEIIFSLSSSVSTNLIISLGCISKTQQRRLRTSRDIFVSPFLNFRMVSCPKIPLFFATVVFIPIFASSDITSILYCINSFSPPLNSYIYYIIIR